MTYKLHRHPSGPKKGKYMARLESDMMDQAERSKYAPSNEIRAQMDAIAETMRGGNEVYSIGRGGGGGNSSRDEIKKEWITPGIYGDGARPIPTVRLKPVPTLRENTEYVLRTTALVLGLVVLDVALVPIIPPWAKVVLEFYTPFMEIYRAI